MGTPYGINVGVNYDGTKWEPRVYCHERGRNRLRDDDDSSSYRRRRTSSGIPVPVYVAAGLGALMVIQGIVDLFSGPSDPGKGVNKSKIWNMRWDRDMDQHTYHVAICGSSGSGKSSLVNALRGISNGTEGSAPTGQSETTMNIDTYPQVVSSMVLYDCPGAGTVRVPAKEYFYHQELYIFDLIVIVHSDRFTEVDIETLKACERHEIDAIIVRSKSDVAIRAVASDMNLGIPRAREVYADTTTTDVRQQLQANSIGSTPVYLVNKDDLRRAVLGEEFTEFLNHENQLWETLKEESRQRAEGERAEDEGAEDEVAEEDGVENDRTEHERAEDERVEDD